jgi:glycosyltransferase involved in cell wall biosynthesis
MALPTTTGTIRPTRDPTTRPGTTRPADGRPAQTRTVLHVDDGVGVWGAQRYLLRLAPLLETRGIRQVLATTPDSELGVAWAGSGRVVARLPRQRPRSLRNRSGRISPVLTASASGAALTRSVALARLSRAHGADLISANSHWTHFDAALAGRLCRTPVMLHLHEEAQEGVAVALRSLSVRLARASLAVSTDVAARLTGTAAARTQVVVNGVDAEVFSPGPPDAALRAEMTSDPTAPLVLSLSRLDATKRVDHVIEAVAQLPGVHLAVAGASTTDGGEEQRLVDLARRRLGDRVRFLGVRDDIPALLRTSDAYVLAGYQEGLPLGILEAQAVGCPAVAYPAAGVGEAITDGGTGLIASGGQPEDLAACLNRILTDSGLGRAMTAAARTRVLDRFSLATQADRCAELMWGATR